MARLIEMGFIPAKRVKSKVSIKVAPSNQGELIPSHLFKTAKDFISKGTLLVIAPSKGYGLAISCASCRNIATCTCGGKLSKRSKTADPACVICGLVYPNWRCTHCHSERIYLLGRGIERIAEEFGKTFRSIPIHIATAEKEIEDVVKKGSVVIATIGAAPLQNYSAVLFLDGLHLTSDLRTEERYLSTLFRYTAMANGNALVVQRPEHPAISALTSWNSFGYLNRLIRDLKEVKLPPHTRHALLKVEKEESGRIANGLLAAIREDRLPADSRVIQISDDVISLFFPIKCGAVTTDFLYQFQKRRSMSGKQLLKMRIDPYLLG
jgi:primosomal protein N' (replication factor Y)